MSWAVADKAEEQSAAETDNLLGAQVERFVLLALEGLLECLAFSQAHKGVDTSNVLSHSAAGWNERKADRERESE